MSQVDVTSNSLSSLPSNAYLWTPSLQVGLSSLLSESKV